MKVLVTGAAGLVGAEVTARLLDDGHEVLALVHRNGELRRNDGRTLRAPGLRTVRGDVTAPGLGLADPPHGLDRIVHCAAVTDFGRPDELYRAVNVEGTREVLALAARAGTPVVHVGTAYVCGERAGRIAEQELDVGQPLANAYERSKLAAERLVREAAADGLPTAVVRPSIVVGAARTGVVRDFKNVYVVLKLTTQGRVRAIPGHFDARLDLVPVDHVANLVAETTSRFDEAAGRTFHAVGGGLTLRDFSDVLAEFPSLRVPRFIPPRDFDPTRLPAVERAYHDKVIALYTSYFTRRISFDTKEVDAFSDMRAPSLGRPFLRRLLDHALRAGYLGPPLPAVEEVLTNLRRP